MKIKLAVLALVVVALSFCAPVAHAQQAHSATIGLVPPSVPTPANLTFKLQRATSSAGPFTQVGNPFTGNSVTDTAVVAGTTYWWRLVSSCPATGAGCGTVVSPMNGDSAPSLTTTGTVPNDSTAPPPATGLTLTLQ